MAKWYYAESRSILKGRFICQPSHYTSHSLDSMAKKPLMSCQIRYTFLVYSRLYKFNNFNRGF